MPYQLISLTFFRRNELEQTNERTFKTVACSRERKFLPTCDWSGAINRSLPLRVISVHILAFRLIWRTIRSLALAFKGEWDVRSYSDAEWALKLRRTGDKGKHTRNNVENTYLPSQSYFLGWEQKYFEWLPVNLHGSPWSSKAHSRKQCRYTSIKKLKSLQILLFCSYWWIVITCKRCLGFTGFL